jgi:hypothetical protein
MKNVSFKMIPDTLKRNGLFLLAYLMAIFVVGCSAKQVILEDVNKYNLSTQTFKYKNIPIYFGVDTQNIKDTFSIYIEGDGRGWISKRKPSDDPTPSNSLVLKLMEKDIRPKVYLARPCMYVQTEFCEQYYWTEGRHHPKLVEAMSKAIDHLKTLYGVSNFELIGHSGGGSMAVLIAEKRSDIKRIITIAGNLDIEAFVKHHRVTAMKGSLNPLYVAEKIQYIPQLHFIGGQDKIVPEKLVANFVKKSASICVQSKVYKDFGHFEDWVSVWSDILNEKPPC